MSEILSHEALQIIWFVLWGLLWAIYFVLDGFDLGMGTLLPFITRNESERRVLFNAGAPFWDGNEVWLITAGGVTFAAFPKAYAVMFSALYAPLLLLLFALIFRAVSFEFRNKIEHTTWNGVWDVFQFLGSFLPALLLGVAFANLFQGIPIDTQGFFHGNLFSLLNLYGILGGVLFVVMFAMHGAIWLGMRSGGDLHERAMAWSRHLWLLTVGCAVAFLFATAHYTPLYNNYMSMPVLWIVPILAVVLLLLLRAFLTEGGLRTGFLLSGGFILTTTFFGVIGMFPNLVPSNLDPAASVSIADAASTQLTLTIMLVVALICVPVVIGYQAWAYSVFSHKTSDRENFADQGY